MELYFRLAFTRVKPWMRVIERIGKEGKTMNK
jgi:hypothetical protein